MTSRWPSCNVTRGILSLTLGEPLQGQFESNVRARSRAFDRNAIDQRAHDAESSAAFGVALEAPPSTVAHLDDETLVGYVGLEMHGPVIPTLGVFDRVAGRFAGRKYDIIDTRMFEPQRF